MGLHFVLASQRLQDLNTKIRGRMRLLLGNVSLDDYELKINRLLKHSKYRKEILSFERGTFLYTANDKVIKFAKFTPTGKPEAIKPLPRAKKRAPTQNPENKVKPKMPLLYKFFNKLGLIPKTSHSLEPEPSNLETNPEFYDVYGDTEEDELDALDEEEGEDLWF